MNRPPQKPTRRARILTLAIALAAGVFVAPLEAAPASTPPAAATTTQNGDVLFRALDDEMRRSMTLHLEDLDRPYFIQFAVDDTKVERVTASYGALNTVAPTHSRTLHTQIRVGSMELDNANFVGGRGGFSRRGSGDLPLEDDYLALRQAIWRVTDSQFKGSVETLTQKRAYLKDRTIPDRPADFTRALAVTSVVDHLTLKFDRPKWEEFARRVSSAFAAHSHIQSSEVRVLAGVENRTMINTEGTRMRYGSSEAVIRISAEAQADDGERLPDEMEFFAVTADGLPRIETVLAAVGDMAARLTRLMKAPVLEDYAGPVLFEGPAAAQLFRQLLARGVAGQPEPVGSRRAAQGADNFENRIGKRILPTSFRVYDDPTVATVQDTPLAGHYRIDDEGIPARRVDLVTGGKLQTLLLSRTPTKRFTVSTGHGRRGSSELPRSAIANLFIESTDPKKPEELKSALIKAADDEGLTFGLRIESLQGRDGDSAARPRRPSGSGRSVSDPVRVYKVYVSDGREELVRGCEFRTLDERNLRRILASGNKPTVDQRVFSAASSSSVVAPAVLLDEVELNRIERESERKPYLPSPQAREGVASR